MNNSSEYETIVHLQQSDCQIEYGIISGNNTIVFIKTGLLGEIHGFENKYFDIAETIKQKHGCTVIVASNPNGYKDDFSEEMKFVKEYALSNGFQDYQVYYIGHSNGAALGMIYAYSYPIIKKVLCINGPLMINAHKLLRGIQGFNGESMYLIYGTKDPSIKMVRLFSELQSEKIQVITIDGADHNFSEHTEIFMRLPELLF